jgi:dTDP-4-dehydrorhamnose reductase
MDEPNPISVYGQTKFDAERTTQRLDRHWIFRVSVLFGPGKLNFIDKGLRKIANAEEYFVASDQIGCATYTLDAARIIEQVITSANYGVYHLSNQGQCSRLELARKAAEIAGVDANKVKGMPLEEMNRPGPRPKKTVLEMRALRDLGFGLPPHWEHALEEYIRSSQ